MKDYHTLLDVEQIGEYSVDEILHDIEAEGFGGVYEHLGAEPTPAMIVKIPEINLFKQAVREAISDRSLLDLIKSFSNFVNSGFYVTKSASYKEWYMPEDTISVPKRFVSRKNEYHSFLYDTSIKHEKKHHLHKTIMQSLVSSEHDDVVEGAVRYLLDHRIDENRLNDLSDKLVPVFPEAELLKDLSSPESIRECRDIIGSIMMGVSPRWTKESFTSEEGGRFRLGLSAFFGGTGSFGFSSMVFLHNAQEVFDYVMELASNQIGFGDVVTPIITHGLWAAGGLIAGKLSYDYVKSSIPYLRWISWNRMVRGLDDVQRFLITALPPDDSSQRDEHLETLESYFEIKI